MILNRAWALVLCGMLCLPCQALELGASRSAQYLPLTRNKRIGLVVNHTARVGDTHILDQLKNQGQKVTKIFAPEHGFRGEADAGAHLDSGRDAKTGLPVISLYGKNKKPNAQQLADVDLLIFDIQDVGVRFYTYISTLHYVLEAAGEQNIPVMIFDRPNPNGHYIAGPILDRKKQSFVGMHPLPLVHGLTMGELARMIVGEAWVKPAPKLHVIPLKDYTHKTPYTLPIKPSPNLPNDHSIALYPSLGLFEGTPVSVGRGTYSPFQILGLPHPEAGTFTFKPQSIPGMSTYPPYQDQLCYGIDLRHVSPPQFTLKYVIDFYQIYRGRRPFFNQFFHKLIGNDDVAQQIEWGWSEQRIQNQWTNDLTKYRQMRKKYLLYPD